MAHYCSECTYLDLDTADIYGKFYCDKRSERHQANEIECYRFCRAYSRSDSVAKSAYDYSVEHSSSSGCYLTTMLCNILGLPDNNIYLNTLRSFRNNYLQANEAYKPLLVEYDIIGPKISNSLSEDPLKEKIAEYYFNNFIIPITKLIEDNENQKAVEQYYSMTSNLKNFYGYNDISISLEEQNKIDIKESGHGNQFVKKITAM